MRKKRWVYIVPAAIVGMVLVTFIGGQIVRLLWNWLLPALFGFPQITFWQAAGLLALCRILFGGSGLMSSARNRRTPEEREKLRQRIREHLGMTASATPAE